MIKLRLYLNKKIIIISILFFLVNLSNVFSEDNDSKLVLSIQDIVEKTLTQNLDIIIDKIEPGIKKKDIIVKKSEFDTSIFFDFSTNKNITPSASAFASPEIGISETINWDMVLSKKFLLGGNYQLKFSNERIKTNSSFSGLNPQYTPRIILSVNQPLLKNFGSLINSKEIKISKNNKEVSDSRFKQKVIDIISEAKKSYWDLVFIIEDYRVKLESLTLAKNFENRIKIQVEVGTLAPIEILQAQSEVASREESVIMAANEVKNCENRIKKILNILDNPATLNKDIIPKDKPIFQERVLSIEESLKTAFEKRLDLLQAKIELKNKKIEIKYKKNQLYPSVDLKGSFGLNGLTGSATSVANLSGGTSSSNFGGTYGKGLERMIKGEYYQWNAGITVDFPLANRSARNQYKMELFESEKLLLMIKNLEQKISFEVREAIRKIKTDIKRIHVTEISRKLAEEKLMAEESRFDVGLSTSFNVLEFQQDLTEEQSKEIKSKVDYKKSIIDFERIISVTLEKNNIKINDS